MKRIQNVSPWGHLDVPLLGRVVESGETVEVEDQHAKILLDQPANWAPVNDAAKEATKK